MKDPLNPPLGGGAGSEKFSVLTFPFVKIHPLRFARPPVSGGQYAGAMLSVVTDCPPETGATRSRATEGVDSFPF